MLYNLKTKNMKLFFQLLSEYLSLKYRLRCEYETHKSDCFIRKQQSYNNLFINEQLNK